MRRRAYRRDLAKRLSPAQKRQMLRPVPMPAAQAIVLAEELASELPSPRTPEKDFQALVVDVARLFGWLIFHPYDSRRSTPGWPDLSMAREGELVFAELKTQSGRVSPEQQVWLDLLASTGNRAFLWRPSDWPEIVDVLSGGHLKEER